MKNFPYITLCFNDKDEKDSPNPNKFAFNGQSFGCLQKSSSLESNQFKHFTIVTLDKLKIIQH